MNLTKLCVPIAIAAIANVCHAESAWPPQTGELAEYFASSIPKAMQAEHVAGAIISVVHAGKTLFSGGYGAAHIGENEPVDPSQSIFRLASVSKLFVATAVMQLVEQGTLDINADVNTYTKGFRIPEAFGAPVTLANLLTHTGGFDDRFLGMAARTPETLTPLGEYLAQRMPPRVMPPGHSMSYSNHGFALAGYVVECVSGMPFSEYVRKNIFEPLRMSRSDFAHVRNKAITLCKAIRTTSASFTRPSSTIQRLFLLQASRARPTTWPGS